VTAPRRPTNPFWYVLGVAGLVASNVLVATGTAAGLRAAVALPTAVIVPGALALRALRLPSRGWDWLLHAVALSLLGLLAVAFTVSLLPGHLLTPVGCLVGLDVLVLATTIAGIRPAGPDPRFWRDLPATRSRSLLAADWRRVLAVGWLRGAGRPRLTAAGWRGVVAGGATVGLGAAAVGLAVAGADRLNRGGDATLAVAALAAAAGALIPAAVAARHRHTTAAATGLYLLGLAVLLATSLRGTGVTGHDIKIEYRVFLETLHRGSWRPGGPFAGYNSCLSITVLPAFLVRLLGVAPLDVFRVCFQVLFATVPVGVFAITRRLLPAGYAVFAAGLFVAFPTFVNDMPMLNRQEIALIFFTVAVLTLVRSGAPARRRAVLFTLLAVGLTASHYTSTYVAAGLLAAAWLLRQVRRRIPRRRRSAPRTPAARLVPAAHGLLGLPAALLIALAIGWAAVTGSAAALGGNLRDTAYAVAARAGVSSASARYSLVAPVRPATDAEAFRLYAAYLRETGTDAGVPTPPADCAVALGPPDLLATTAGGTLLEQAGIRPATVNTTLRRAAVALFEGGALAGCLLWWLRTDRRRGRHRRRHPDRRSRRRNPDPQSRRPGGDRPRAVDVRPELATAAVVLLAATVAAPQLSDSYGLLRLYLQLLVVLAPAVLLALVMGLRLVVGAGRRWRRAALDAAVGAVAIGCLLTTTGLVPKVTGEFPPQLNLTNAGPYFRAYYATPDDVAAMRWVTANVAGHGYVVADSRDSANLRAMTPLYPLEGLLPGAVPADGYLAVSSPDGRSAVAMAVLGDRVLRYTFPLDCVTAGRTLRYAAGPRRIYSPVAGTVRK
jgi:hypothetical protein